MYVHTVYITLHSKTNICVIINNYRIFFFLTSQTILICQAYLQRSGYLLCNFFFRMTYFYLKTCTNLARARARAKRRKATKKILKLITLKWLVFFYNYSLSVILFIQLLFFVNQIKNVTCNRDLTYIGHSMGCTSLLVTASQVPGIAQHLRYTYSPWAPMPVLQ